MSVQELNETVKDTTPKNLLINGSPSFNVVNKDDFQERAQQVFHTLGDCLAKSFGAYGAPTIISNMASRTVTKDGFTIMKNLLPDTVNGSPIDSVFYDIASNTCGRLNYKVGDGTTTAMIATNAIYDAYMQPEMKNMLDNSGFLPREIMETLNTLKDEIIQKINVIARPIRGEEDMVDKISNIVRISSNGNEELTSMITDIYSKLGYPNINCSKASDGVTKYNIIDGFKSSASLTDKMYINTDNKTAEYNDVDVLIFDHKISRHAYTDIIRPMWELIQNLGRQLVVIAPFYDNVLLNTDIKRDINESYKKERQLDLVLLVAKTGSASDKKSLSDLAMLLNTTMIDINLETKLLEKIRFGVEPYRLFNIALRHIPGITIIKDNTDNTDIPLDRDVDDGETQYPFILDIDSIRVGFARSLVSDIDYSVFNGFYYNHDLYQKTLSEAKSDWDDAVDKYSKLSTFSFETLHAQQRYNNLCLKLASIEVGGDSILSQNMLYDSVEDSVKAAESAYTHGYIKGCNLTTLECIDALIPKFKEGETVEKSQILRGLLLDILKRGFLNVYGAVLNNAFGNGSILINTKDIVTLETSNDVAKIVFEELKNRFGDIGIESSDALLSAIGSNINLDKIKSRWFGIEKEEDRINQMGCMTFPVTLLITTCSMVTGLVFDLNNMKFSNDIINSAKTDTEVLTATIDLVSILINGNQLVMTTKENFQRG